MEERKETYRISKRKRIRFREVNRKKGKTKIKKEEVSVRKRVKKKTSVQ